MAAPIPEPIKKVLEKVYQDGVSKAVQAFSQSAADEDSLTGALGQALYMQSRIVRSNGSEYTVSTTYKKLRGRGNSAPEKKLGADGIFQFEVDDTAGHTIFRKGLPFQSKKNWNGTDATLLGQARNMMATGHGGIVIDYSSQGYQACPIDEVISANGSRTEVDRKGSMQSLGNILGKRFAGCAIGKVGLYFDVDHEDYRMDSSNDLLVISTKVKKTD